MVTLLVHASKSKFLFLILIFVRNYLMNKGTALYYVSRHAQISVDTGDTNFFILLNIM